MYTDRTDAGNRLAPQLELLSGTGAVVMGLARGGVAVGAAVAEALGLPLGVLVVRKVGAPNQKELAIGAVGETGVRHLDDHLVRVTGASERFIQAEIEREVTEARRREATYGKNRPATIRGRTAIVVDDGIATGATALVGLLTARDLGAAHVILATPVASRQAVQTLAPYAESMTVLATPDPFIAVGMYYSHFDQVSDGEVIHLLEVAQRREDMAN